MKYTLLSIFAFLTFYVQAQTLNGYFQFDASSDHVSTADYERMANGNLAIAMYLRDSTVLNPGNDHFYNEPIAKNPGTGLVVVTPNNTVLWSHSWFPENYMSDFIYILDVTTDANNNIYVSGGFKGLVDIDPTAGINMIQPINANNVEGFLIKLDANGNFLWNKRFIAGPSYAVCYLDRGFILSNGSLRFTGKYFGNVDFDPSSAYNPKNSGGTKISGFYLTLDSAGNYIEATTANSYTQQGGIIDYHLDHQQNQYAIYYCWDSINVDLKTGSTIYRNNGENTSSFCIAKYDTAYNLLWSKQFDSDFGTPQITMMNNYFYLFSNFKDTTIFNDNSQVISQGKNDMVYEKWDLNGNCLWSKSLQNPGNAYIANLIERNNELMLIYTYEDSISTGTAANDTTLYSNNVDLGLSRFSLSGNHIFTNEIKSDSAMNISGRGLYEHGSELLISLQVESPTEIDPSASSQIINTNWTSKYSRAFVFWQDAAVGISETNNTSDQLKIYPNPAKGQFTIELEKKSKVFVYSTIGQLLATHSANVGLNDFDVSGFVPGNYIVTVTDKVGYTAGSKLITIQ